ncbi:hypothetical protein SAMN04490182_4106 [Pseudomonas cedrina]|uniref:Type III secretion effector protein n=1 Tax=Pseudomonas cedrina TaxID=651740 RepID=A0ABY0UX62_PSECE|nr:hypothetical protein SAMN04490182_4106 [Pseudomonas cedrina]
MDPMSAVTGLLSAAMPLATKALEIGADLIKEMMKGQGKPGDTGENKAPSTIEF